MTLDTYRRAWFLAAAVSLGATLAATPAAAQSWNDIVAAAEKEGALAVITPPVRTHRETVLEFQKAYPKITLSATSMPASSFEPRVQAERKSGVYAFDVMVGGLSTSTYSLHIPNNWYVPLRELVNPDIRKDELWMGGFDSGFMDKGRKFVLGFAANISNNFLIDRAVVPVSELAGMEDLLKPQWKGKIAFYDPRLRGPGGSAFAQFYFALGREKAERLLKEQDVVLTATLRQATEWVVRGRYPIVIGVPVADLAEYKKNGLGMKVEALDMPERFVVVTPSWGGLGLFDKAPHPNAARVFVNWLLSKEGQTDWAQRGSVNSRRKDVAIGDPGTAINESLWNNGLSMAREESEPIRRDAMAVASEALNK